MGWNNALTSKDIIIRSNMKENLKYLRLKNGLSLGQLAKKLGLSRGSVGCLESSGYASQERFEMFSKFYGIELETLKLRPIDFIKQMEKTGE